MCPTFLFRLTKSVQISLYVFHSQQYTEKSQEQAKRNLQNHDQTRIHAVLLKKMSDIISLSAYI